MIVYKIMNKINGKVYIGQTTITLERRWKYHCYSSSGCRYLHNAIEKYGPENFIVQQIDTATSKIELDEKEKYWIDYYNSMAPNGYNLKSGGNTPIYSEASRKRMSENHIDVNGPKNPRFGAKLSAETKQKISLANIGKTAYNKKILRNIDTGEIMAAKTASEKYGISISTLHKACKNWKNQTTAAGYHWEYVGGDAHV